MTTAMPTRRTFLLTLAAGAVVSITPRARAAATPAPGAPATATPTKRPKSLVVIFQRGAVDALSMVPPVGDALYAGYRPSIAIPAKGDDAAIPLDSTFALHPALAPLKAVWDAKRLAIVHAVGSPDPTRSHFDAQDFVETGTPGVKATDDGWLNRYLVARSAAPAASHGATSPPLPPTGSPLRAVALQPNRPRILAGDAAVVAMGSLGELKVNGPAANVRDFEHMYAAAVDQALRGTAADAFDAIRSLRAVQSAPSAATYPTSPLGKRLQAIAQLIRADAGVEVAVTECGGWDTHAGQGASKGQLASRLDELGASIAAFATDLGDRLDDVCLVTVTEFGRTVRENGTKGTDHGHGSVMLVLGGKVRGKRVVAKWKGLAEDQLWQGRDLPVTADHRDVFAEVLRAHLGQRDLATIFPQYTPARVGLFA
jgi:uncharacterized protein (DUF1501 family)